MRGGALISELKRTGGGGVKPICTSALWNKLPDFQTAGRALSDKLQNVFCFEPSLVFFYQKSADIFFSIERFIMYM